MSWNIKTPGDYINGPLTVAGVATFNTHVGIGNSPSAWAGIGPVLQVEQASLLSESSNQLYLTANGYFAGGQWNYINSSSADQYYQLNGSHVWRTAISGSAGTAIGWSTLATLNSTGLGIGASPSDKLTVNGGASFTAFGINANPINFTGTGQSFARFRNAGGDFYFGIEGSVGGSFFTGSTAYSACLFNANNTPLHFFTNGGLRATISTGGQLLLGTTTATASLDNAIVQNRSSGFVGTVLQIGGVDKAYAYIASADSAYRVDSVSGYTIKMVSSTGGVILANGATAWAAVSDERKKDIIEPISNALAKIGSLRSVIGKYKDEENGTRRSFLIAQDVQNVLPEAVDTIKDELVLRYSDVIPLLVAAIKELTARVVTIENA